MYNHIRQDERGDIKIGLQSPVLLLMLDGKGFHFYLSVAVPHSGVGSADAATPRTLTGLTQPQ